jgi:hypothetical protein
MAQIDAHIAQDSHHLLSCIEPFGNSIGQDLEFGLADRGDEGILGTATGKGEYDGQIASGNKPSRNSNRTKISEYRGGSNRTD